MEVLQFSNQTADHRRWTVARTSALSGIGGQWSTVGGHRRWNFRQIEDVPVSKITGQKQQIYETRPIHH